MTELNEKGKQLLERYQEAMNNHITFYGEHGYSDNVLLFEVVKKENDLREEVGDAKLAELIS